VVSPTNAPHAGETVTLWATGLGPVTRDETLPAAGGDMPNVRLQVLIGGKPANILYRGRNACCSAVDTIYVTVPQGLSGCANSVIMQIGNLVSNPTNIPIGTNSRSCQPINQKPAVFTQGTFSVGGWGHLRKITASSSATADQTPGSTSTGTFQSLDAGNISVNGPWIAGSRQLGKSTSGGTIFYQANLDMTATTLRAGTYTFTGAGGEDVGPFTASYNAPPPFVWTNQASLATITRANGAAFTWTGGDPAGYVTIAGSSSFYGATTATSGVVQFTCTARVRDSTFTVPPIVLLALPPSASAPGVNFATPGGVEVSTFGSFTAFKASGIDYGGPPKPLRLHQWGHISVRTGS
jgi:hypothetical protein